MKLMKKLLLAALTLGSALATPAMAQDKDVKFALDFIPLGRHAPWYVALDKGYFKEQILPIELKTRKGTVVFDRDEHPRADTTGEKLAQLKVDEGQSRVEGNNGASSCR